MNIIVTGASRGIGYELVRKLALADANRVLAISRNEEKLEELKKSCLEENPLSGILTMPADLEDLEDIEDGLKERITTHFSSLDVLVNNAGLLIKKNIDDLPHQDAARMMTVNFLAPMLLTRSLMSLLQSSGTAHVLNIGSMAGFAGGMKFPGLAGYSASKAAIHILTECQAAEYPDSGVRFNALALGASETEMLAEAFPGLKAPLKAAEMAEFIKNFALTGHRYFNGKTLPVAVSTP